MSHHTKNVNAKTFKHIDDKDLDAKGFKIFSKIFSQYEIETLNKKDLQYFKNTELYASNASIDEMKKIISDNKCIAGMIKDAKKIGKEIVTKYHWVDDKTGCTMVTWTFLDENGKAVLAS